jgi:hypothetical protein
MEKVRQQTTEPSPRVAPQFSIFVFQFSIFNFLARGARAGAA